MSLGVLDMETMPFQGRVAVLILNEVVPTILDKGVFIGRRLSLAYTWYLFLCQAVKRCPENIPPDYDEWSEKHLKELAKELVDYASRIIDKIVHGSI